MRFYGVRNVSFDGTRVCVYHTHTGVWLISILGESGWSATLRVEPSVGMALMLLPE